LIVASAELVGLRGRVAMVDGGFDPLHDGHVDYFRAAAELGSPVLCNVSSDRYVETKHPPLLRDEQRVRLIDAIRHVDYVHLSHRPTAEVLRDLRPRMYVKGSDWEGRLPKEEIAICQHLGIEVVFLDTVRDSSSRILDDYLARARP
jgi:cytidyltransferase-like protein